MSRFQRLVCGCLYLLHIIAVCAPLTAFHDALAQDVSTIHRTAAMITSDEVRRHVYVLADDSMRGRWTPSPQLERGAQYIADEFRKTGVRPLGDDMGYFQRYKIDALQVLPESAAVWSTGPTSIGWKYGYDYVFPMNDWSNWTSEGQAILLHGSPGGIVTFDTSSMRGRALLVPQGLGNQYKRIADWHPAAVVYLDNVPDSVLLRIAKGQERPTRPERRRPGGGEYPYFLMSYRAAAPLISKAGVDVAELRRATADTVLQAFPLKDQVIHITFRVKMIAHEDPANVIGIVRGSDPVLRNEYVVYSAHFDHLGIGRPIKGDSIYNGADDNASGTAAVLAVAKAFSNLAVKPRRSVIFALVSGEEFLGLGSEFFVDHPPVPLSDIVVNLNADMVGRNSKDTVIVVGMRDSDLGKVVDRVTSLEPELQLAVIDSSDRPNEAKDLYSWSDHAAFIQKGIPFLYFYSGMHEDHHRPSDSADKINDQKLARISRLMFHVGLEVANAERRPRWDADRYSRLVPNR